MGNVDAFENMQFTDYKKYLEHNYSSERLKKRTKVQIQVDWLEECLNDKNPLKGREANSLKCNKDKFDATDESELKIGHDNLNRSTVSMTSSDKKPDINIFPSVRRLVNQFNRLIASDSDALAVENRRRKCNSRTSDYHNSGKYFFHSASNGMETDTSDHSSKFNSKKVSYENIQSLESVNETPGGFKYLDLRCVPAKEDMLGNDAKWKSASDNNINRSLLTKDCLARLDSGAGDLFVDKKSRCLSWSKESTLSQDSVSRDCLSPTVSSTCGSVGNLSCMSRSISADGFFDILTRWDRSNSSDSAVVVEDENIPSESVSPLLQNKRFSMTCPSNFEDSSEKPNYTCDKIELRNASRRLADDNTYKRKARPPSVVISDHSEGSASVLHVALASDGFSLRNVINSSSDYFLNDGYICPRKVSECSTCSSVSTIDMHSPTINKVPYDYSLKDWKSSRRSSDCSSCYLTASDDDTEVEVALMHPTPPPVRKSSASSNWRKVRNVVQWTPFIQTYKRHKYPWVQLAGHQGNFRAGYKQGTIMKKLCPDEEKAFESLMKDVLKPHVPEYLGVVDGSDNEKYLQLEDLLSNFSSACVMDIKMGVRTYLEEELAKARIKPKLRKDMYEKMVQIDNKAPTDAEHRAKAVTKPRYMVWRETISSTATLGFRIEGVRKGDGTSSKDFKTTRTRDQVSKVVLGFMDGYPNVMAKYIQKLKEIRETLEKSTFFKSHELIGSSLLFVHNNEKCDVWLIDFAKTIPLPKGVNINHETPWIEGTHEDGYLIGFDNLIDLMEKSCKTMEVIAETPKTSDTGQLKPEDLT